MKRQRLFYKLGGKGKLKKSKFYLGQTVVDRLSGLRFKVLIIAVQAFDKSSAPSECYTVLRTEREGVVRKLYGQDELTLATVSEWRQLHPKKPKITTEDITNGSA